MGLHHKGFTIAILIRLSPIIPFNAINYILGLTSMKLHHYVLALIGLLPGTVMYCFIGATAGSLTESGNAVSGPVAIGSIVFGIVFGLLAVFGVSYYAKNEFNKISIAAAAEEEQNIEDEENCTATNTQADDSQQQIATMEQSLLERVESPASR